MGIGLSVDATSLVLTGLWFDRGTASPKWLLAFEAYGHAMACASALELLLALSCWKRKVRDHQAKHSQAAPHQDYLRMGERLQKMTLSRLIQESRRVFRLSPELLEGLEIAKSSRDRLAHSFWDSHLGLLHSDNGIDLIVEGCNLECWHYKNLCSAFENEVGFDVMDFVEITKKGNKTAVQGMEDLLRQFR